MADERKKIGEVDQMIRGCYESPKKETVSHTFKHLIQNLKSYNEIKV